MEQDKIINLAKQIINDEPLLMMLCDLKSRWQDEREYEDFRDYEKAVKDHITKAYGLTCKMNKRFLITIPIDNIKLFITTRTQGDYVKLVGNYILPKETKIA